jgi:glucose-6-phosphate dehydrogenase assembly protein OpcA
MGVWRPGTREAGGSGASDTVGAQISTFCHRLGGGGRHVCCEEIALLARGAAAGRLREAVLPLLVPDLPVFLWLPESAARRQSPVASSTRADDAGPGSGGRRLESGDWRLESGVWSLADEVIWSARDAADALPALSLRSRAPGLVDLDWVRLQPWRELTAQWFDAPPGDRKQLLARLEAAEIEVAGPEPARPGAGWLWAGWLASRLGWKYEGQGAGPGERRFTGPDGPVTAQVRVTPARGLDAGEPLAVRLRLRGAAEPLLLQRHLADDPAELWITGTGGRCVRLGRRDEAALLSEALDGATRDRVYVAAWQLAVHLWRG